MRFKGLKWPLRLASSIAVRVAIGSAVSAIILAALVAVLAIALAAAADKPGFQAKSAASYPNKQSSENLTIAAAAYTTDEETKEPFGKLNPWKYNILPVLVVIQNDGSNAIRLEKIHFQYELPDRSKSGGNAAASDVKYSQGPNKPKVYTGPLGGVKVTKPKSPLSAFEIESRAFVAKIIPSGQTVSGFVYFETEVSSAGASIYISGLENASTGKELYYFEIPLSGK